MSLNVVINTTSNVSAWDIRHVEEPSHLLKLQLEKLMTEDQIPHFMEGVKRAFGSMTIEEISLLTGGRGTSKILKFKQKGKEYVCRMTDSQRPDFFINSSQEIQRMSLANKLQLTPKVHYADEKTGVLIMDYVQDTHLTTQIVKYPTSCKKLHADLADQLRTLHSGPNFSEYTNIFVDVLKTAKATKAECMPPIACHVVKVVTDLEGVLEKYRTSVPSHKELNSNNVLFDGKKIYFIDWESSANSDRFVDLAITSNFFIFDDAQEQLFLKRYFSRSPTEKEQAQLVLMKVVCLAFYGFKAMRRVTGVGKQDLSKQQVDFTAFPSYKEMLLNYFNGCTKVLSIDDFKMLTYVFLQEATDQIKSPKFQQALAVLRSTDIPISLEDLTPMRASENTKPVVRPCKKCRGLKAAVVTGVLIAATVGLKILCFGNSNKTVTA